MRCKDSHLCGSDVTSAGDKRLLMEGRKRHGDAINLLRQDLEAMKTSDEVDEGVITAAYTLGNTEVRLAFQNFALL